MEVLKTILKKSELPPSYEFSKFAGFLSRNTFITFQQKGTHLNCLHILSQRAKTVLNIYVYMFY